MITLSIDVTKLDKNRFKHVVRKDGTKAVFCDLVLFETKNGYGDYAVTQSVSKEGRANGVKLPIIGNAKIFQKSSPPQNWSERKGGNSARGAAPNPELPAFDPDVGF